MSDSYLSKWRRIRRNCKDMADCLSEAKYRLKIRAETKEENSFLNEKDEDFCDFHRAEPVTVSEDVDEQQTVNASMELDVSTGEQDSPEKCLLDSDFDEFSSSSDSENSENDDYDLVRELGRWASSFNITVVAVSALLSLLRIYHPSLPKDPRTVMKTARHINVRTIEGGSYYHFGITNCLSKLKGLTDYLLSQTSKLVPVIHLQINVDGLPLFKTSSTQLWPITGRVCKPIETDPFLIGLYCGGGCIRRIRCTFMVWVCIKRPTFITLRDFGLLLGSTVRRSIAESSSSAPATSATDLVVQMIPSFFEKTLKQIQELKNAVEILQRKMDQQTQSNVAASNTTPAPPDTFLFPLQEIDQLQRLNNALAEEGTRQRMVCYLSYFGGQTPKEALYRILMYLLAPKLSILYSLEGRKGKLRFNTLQHVKTTIYDESLPDILQLADKYDMVHIYSVAKYFIIKKLHDSRLTNVTDHTLYYLHIVERSGKLESIRSHLICI
ncbi:uncharacterized protein LOC112574075 isoform X2 [Pomacea canaliculata]|uniref:uncharacterized protein LOC112574075 isoform X2 n=1 Tax=Pomacea canaliculata TaxID=400727 RepID=UPI000D726A1F|nr:uncharacterized protein LOC112574075 isoform X2 [Pomacea canaliculata]